MKTSMSRHDFVLVETVWFILLIAGITATITEGPSNTVAEIGKQVKLNCSGDAPIGYWFFSKNGAATDEEAIVGPECSAPDPSYGDHYTVETIGGGTTCNLIVFNITMKQAGVYRCLEALNSVFSILTVIDGAVGVGASWSSQLIAIGGITCEIGVITGWSSGNPPPIYEWFDTKENVSVINHQTLDLAEINRNYTCVAHNTIRNEVHRGSRSFVVQSYKTTQDCRFPRNEITWISATPIQDCYNGTCACSSGYDGFTLLCNANSYPSALYQWIGADNNANCPRLYENVKTNGMYRCTTYFDQASSNYTGNVIFPNGTSEKSVTECYQFKGIQLPTA